MAPIQAYDFQSAYVCHQMSSGELSFVYFLITEYNLKSWNNTFSWRGGGGGGLNILFSDISIEFGWNEPYILSLLKVPL